jgi:Sap-like sulfolipid-1-addressing protein
MMELLINLFALALVGACSPLLISVCIMLLSTGRPIGNAIAYILGLVLSLVIVGSLALVLLDESTLLSGLRRGISPQLSLALGGICLAAAVGAYLHVPDPDAPPPKWLASIGPIVPSRAFMIGIVLLASNIKIWIIYAIGVTQILAAGLGRATNLILLLVFVLIFQVGVLAPLMVYLWRPQGAETAFKALRARLDEAYRWIGMVIFGVLGSYLLVSGLIKS